MKFLADLSKTLDASGECGSLVHYGIVIILVGGAFLIFLYLWNKGKLDMDEQPKIDMMQEPPGKRDDDHESK